MARDIGQRLKDHLKWLLNTQLMDEITYQIESPWASYFDKIIALTIQSRDNQKQAFADANQAQLDYETRHEKAMAVFNFFKGIALSFLSAQIQYRLFANFFHKTEWQDTDSTWETGLLERVEVEDTYANKIGGKMFADLGKGCGDFLFEWIGKSITPPAARVPNLSTLANSPTPEDLRRNMNDEMRQQKDHMVGVMQKIADDIEADTEIGDRIVEKTKKFDPWAFTGDDGDIEKAGQRYLNNQINELRESWAKTPGFEFFAYNPPNRPDYLLVRHMERELWVLWYLEFHHHEWKDHVVDAVDFIKGNTPWYDSILKHMSDLMLPTDDELLTLGPARERANQYFVDWCRKHKPEDPTRAGKNIRRDLKNPPIEKWSRPDRR